MYIRPKITKDKLFNVCNRLCALIQTENIQNPAIIWKWRETAESNPEATLTEIAGFLKTLKIEMLEKIRLNLK